MAEKEEKKGGLIPLEKIWEITDGGRTVIESIYPQSATGFNTKKNFKVRSDDSKASCSVFKSGKVWLLHDKGGGDNKAYTAITLIQREKGLTFYDAICYIAKEYCKGLVTGEHINIEIKPDIKKAEKNYNEFSYETKEFTESEFLILGNKIKKDGAYIPAITKEICDLFNCSSLKWYATVSKDDKPSYIISSTDDYPIFLFSYKDKEGKKFYKVYQPFSQDYRFIYFGKKPDDFIFSDNHTAKSLNMVMKKEAPESMIEQLFIVSGASDAMNLFANCGYHVVWFNSETTWGKLSDYHYNILKRTAYNIYNVPDLDETGKRQSINLCLRYLDIHTVWLPEDLQTFKTKGKTCKDIKDFFNVYKNDRYKELSFMFKELVRISSPMRFWDKTEDEDGNVKLNFSNERIYNFLHCNGILKHESIKTKKQWIFVHLKGNIVHEIDEANISDYVNNFVIRYIKMNLMYYDKILIDKIHRSNDFKLASLSKLDFIKLDFKAFDEGYDHFFFRNCAWRISASGIEQYNLNEYKKFVWSYKVVDFHVRKIEKPLFEVDYLPSFKQMVDKMKSFPLNSDEYKALQKEIEGTNDLFKYKLTINENNFSYIKYLYNTGKVHWRKEQAGEQLTLEEYADHDLFFISKVVALGYILYRYKEYKKAYAIYATETEMNENGEHNGGTGKSIFMQTPAWAGIRTMSYIDGQNDNKAKDDFVFGNVTADTDFIFMEDLARNFNIHRFLNSIQGNMAIESKYVQGYVLSFKDSPKIMINSNHTPYHLDAALRRRLWFLGFCDYYHAANEIKGVKEYTPSMEFVKDLVVGYNDVEKNMMYNFLAQCLVTYLKFQTKIESPLDSIMQRNIRDKVGERFIEWAEDFFTEDKLNVNLKRNDLWDAYLTSFSPNEQKTMKNDKWFKEKISTYALYKGFKFNPADVIGTGKDDLTRNRIRVKEGDKWVEYIHLRNEVFPDTITNETQIQEPKSGLEGPTTEAPF